MNHHPVRCPGLGSVLVGTALAFCTAPAWSDNHALILAIGKYAEPTNNLPGIDLDARHAREIALAMGVPAANIRMLQDEQLTWKGIAQALGTLADRVKKGDKVMLAYSGHGASANNVSGTEKKCSEGIAAYDGQIYFDRELQDNLERLGAKASQVVMFNDSCFSGGASIKALGLVAKKYPGPLRMPAASGTPAGTEARECGDAVNKGFLSKTLEVVRRAGANVLYVAAAAENEYSYASPKGSLATLAWAQCIADPKADADGSGIVTGEELRTCSQARIDAGKYNVTQHITLTGNTTLPVLFGPAAASASAPAATRVDAARVLQDLHAGGSQEARPTLTAAKSQVRIGEDSLEFDITLPRAGYLYVFQVGSDGKTINLLFPNDIDGDNKLPAGQVRLPRASWALRAGGPAGQNHLLALLYDQPHSFADIMSKAGSFRSVAPTRGAAKNLYVVATSPGAGQQAGYGASEVITITEVAK